MTIRWLCLTRPGRRRLVTDSGPGLTDTACRRAAGRPFILIQPNRDSAQRSNIMPCSGRKTEARDEQGEGAGRGHGTDEAGE